MIEGILNIFGSIAKIVADWPQRKLDNAKKKYANWRAGAELRALIRARRAADSLDDSSMRDGKGKTE